MAGRLPTASAPPANVCRPAPAFDRVCSDNHIEHRLIKPRRPQTNGRVERFNGRIADVLRTHRFDSTASLQATLKRFVYLYITTSHKKVCTTKRHSGYSNIGTLKNPIFSKKIHAIIRDFTF